MRHISRFAVVTTASLSVSALISQAPVARIGNLTLPDPQVNTTVISNDGNGNLVHDLQQCEVRSLGGGLYRVAATVKFWNPGHTAALAEASLITGNLNLAVVPPIWTPNQDVAAFNQLGTSVDEYQLSISINGLNAVWDRYAATVYPNSGAASNSFCCHRANTGVPFNINDIRSITNVGAGGVDPHIGEELANGHVILYHIDFVTTGNAIVKGDLDPVTGIMGATTLVAPYIPATTGFNHSPFVHRDSLGKARALNYSEYPAQGPTNSSAFYTEGVNNDGTTEKIIDGAIAPVAWYNNPGLVGGSWHYTTSGGTEPQLREVTMCANTTLVGGSGRIVGWAPARPVPASGVFVSLIGIGIDVTSVAALPYQVPPVIGDIWIFPTVGITGGIFHDPYTGIAEWIFNGVPAFNATFTIQMVTLDANANQVLASNTALFNV